MRSLLTLSLLVSLPVLAQGQEKKDKTDRTSPIRVVKLERKEPVTYEKDIEPIFANKCLVCHSGTLKEGKFDLATYESMMKGGKRGTPVIPGKSAESLLVKLVGKVEKPLMPPKSEEPLTPEELAMVKLWIDQGAKAPSGKRERPRVIITALPTGVVPVRAIAVSPDRGALAAGRANQVHVYDAGSGTHIRTLLDAKLQTPDKKPGAHVSIVESLAFTADGRYLASGSFQEVALWDAQTGMLRSRIPGFVDRVVALAFSPDGKLLATGGGAAAEDGEVKIIDVTTGKVLTEVKNAHSDTCFGVAFSPDGKMLATCGADKFVKVFEVPGGKFIKSFEGHTHHVMDVGWKHDGKLLASAGADNAIKVWNFENGEQARTINAAGKQLTRLAFVGKTSQVLVCSGDNNARLWNVDNGGGGVTFSGSKDFLYAIGASGDGKIIAVGGEEGVVRLYNGSNGQLIKALLPPGAEPPPEPKK